jgi:hypothetical protein
MPGKGTSFLPKRGGKEWYELFISISLLWFGHVSVDVSGYLLLTSASAERHG